MKFVVNNLQNEKVAMIRESLLSDLVLFLSYLKKEDLLIFNRSAIPGINFFFIFVTSTVNSKYFMYKILLMAEFEPRTSGN